MLMQKLLASAGEESKLYSDDVFQAFTRTGTGADVAVTTGIDMTKGYMLWSKGRSGATDHAIYDSARGLTYDLASNTAAAQTTQATGLKAVSATGHTIGSLAKMNTSAATYVDFVFRRAPKFFDVVTYTGTGTNQTIPHNLGAKPGLIIIKRTDAAANWAVGARISDSQWVSSRTAGGFILNGTAATTAPFYSNAASATSFNTADAGANYEDTNTLGAQYVAYLFAHDPSADGIIQCGSFTTDASGNATVNLGWEPQWLMLKRSNGVENWTIIDNMRGWTNSSAADPILEPNTSGAEYTGSNFGNPTATGFQIASFSASSDYIYIAIRRPNKPPTTGTQVYNAIARTGTGAAATVTAGFPVDLVITKKRSSTTLTGAIFTDRLRGKTNWLDSTATTAETITADTITGLDSMTGVVLGADATTSAFNTNSHTYVDHFFKRSPGFFDVVCYTGDGQNNRDINHGLGAVPTFAFIKERDGTAGWTVKLPAGNGATMTIMSLNSNFGSLFTLGNPSTATTFNVHSSATTGNTNAQTNNSNKKYVAFLFASYLGISKVGSYTGNGSSQTINCGFTTGARFILIKRTDAAGDWYIWDTARGIVSANDPHISLNTTAAEVTTDDSVDPTNEGFIVNNVSPTNINVNAGQYIFLAIA